MIVNTLHKVVTIDNNVEKHTVLQDIDAHKYLTCAPFRFFYVYLLIALCLFLAS